MKKTDNEAFVNYHAGHRQRVKERFLSEGLDNFSPHNILELVLFYTNKRKDTNVIAHKLIDRFGSFAKVLDAPFEVLCEVPEVGRETATLLKMIPELSKMYLISKNEMNKMILDRESAISTLSPLFIGKDKECLAAAFLGGTGEVLTCRILSEGDNNTVVMDVSRILYEVTANHADAIVIAHNHPNGYAVPSVDDIEITDNLANLLREMRVGLCDHLIFGRDGVLALSQCEQYPRDYFCFL